MSLMPTTAVRFAFLIGVSVLGSVEAAAPAEKKSADKPSASGFVAIVARAGKACFSARIGVDGVLMARAEAMVSPESEGFRITQVAVQEGDRVSAGQVLARLTRSGDGGSTSTALLRAPAAGVVIRSTAAVGAVASARAEPLFRIAIDGEIEVVADVPSLYVPELVAGETTARVELEDGRDLSGRVRLVPAEIDPQTQLGRARISVDNDASLRAGTFVRVTMDARRSCGVAVPRSAVQFRTEGMSVQVVHDGAVESRRVRVGLFSEGQAEIREGVREGEVIVANGGTTLRDGDKVKPMFADEIAAGER